jgi:hypothetical protein
LFRTVANTTKTDILLTGAQIRGQQFLVANTTVTDLTVGLMGVGLGASFFNEVTFTDYNLTYTNNITSTNTQTARLRDPNIVDQMAAQGIINSRAFGLDLGSGTEGD